MSSAALDPRALAYVAQSWPDNVPSTCTATEDGLDCLGMGDVTPCDSCEMFEQLVCEFFIERGEAAPSFIDNRPIDAKKPEDH